ncbi:MULTISPECIES: GTP 3',8-cyclase MoaA [Halomonadaceae]|uniref:GTP 3',8-cyclase n=1 Tax=Vreelandella halophila TaxID=86177 RepID=A0A9X4YAE3_9GAMM|nr:MULTISPECIES: GTP 3',8-cyclase MoaA [Halomonas]MYL26124.1 GTP 3',8-cyclase MoaA [Halomonas utahensis]MYL73314.1 GTP 3',8-cyclase MoaA [Halomonas sp. 22501_18_FS]
MSEPQKALVDQFGRTITYVRISVTDRCDFRCVYCMSEDMEFLPRQQVLSLEEIGRIARIFRELGVEKIRLTGGEPLVRKGIVKLVEDIGGLGLDDLAMTTNGSQLPHMAHDLKTAGMDRLNISLDSLDAEKFRSITRTGDLNKVIRGIDTAVEAGFKGIKLNSVIMKNRNDHEVLDLVEFARSRGIDISFIEEMPLGEISDHTRDETFCSSDEVREIIEQRYDLIPSTADTGGPSRYFRMPDSQSKIGFISPHTHNFCGDCNRVRLTVEGRLLLCLGNEHSKDLKGLMRRYPEDDEPIREAIISAMDLKPKEHHFTTDGDVQILRFMNMTGG